MHPNVSPAVSVVIPAYRAAGYIAETVESVLAQTFRDYELIVVNDGCPETARLEAVLEPYRSRINYIVQSNQGPGGAKNTGIRAARAPLVATLDADDIWMPDYLQVQVAALQAGSAVDVMYPDAILFGDSPLAGRRFSEQCPSSGEVTFEALLTQKCNVFTSVLARKDALQ